MSESRFQCIYTHTELQYNRAVILSYKAKSNWFHSPVLGCLYYTTDPGRVEEVGGRQNNFMTKAFGCIFDGKLTHTLPTQVPLSNGYVSPFFGIHIHSLIPNDNLNASKASLDLHGSCVSV